MAKRKVKEDMSVVNIDICDEMKKSYLDYSMAVIVGRAIPDLKDGLKPVHRRILFMSRYTDKFTKSARVVGDTLSNLHPHSDSSVYEALVRLAQPFKMYIPTVEGHGNFGSIQGDSAASMRYCIIGESEVNTSLGTKPIKEIYDIFDNGNNSEEIIIPKGELKVKSMNGQYNDATRIFSCGKHDIIKISLTNGLTLEGTPNHPVLTLDDNLHYRWVLLEDIKCGMEILLEKNESEENHSNNINYHIKHNLSVELLDFIEDFNTNYNISSIENVEHLEEKKNVYTFRVDSDCHSYISNRIISHNTEYRMGRHSHILYFGDRMDGIDWKNNYDDSIQEPTFLPCIFPMILVNGSSGMAVGMATNIPPHNILEVLDTYIAYIQKKLNLNNIRKYLPGPDTCIPASIIDSGGIDRAYTTGKGSYSVASNFTIEEASYGRHNIIFTSVLPDKNTAGVVEKIARLVKDGKLDGISDIADESSMAGIRIVVTTKKGVSPKDLVTTLFGMNICYDRYGMSMLAIYNGVPKIYNIMDLFRDFHTHNTEMHTKIFTTKIDKFKHRLKLLAGLDTVIKKYEEAIKIITSAKSKLEAMEKIKKKYKLDDDQAEYILSSKLYSFVSKGNAIAEEVRGIQGDLKILEDNMKDIDAYLIGELKKLKVTFKSFKRRSNITVIKK